MGSPRLQKEDLCKDDFVVQLLQLFQKTFRHLESLAMVLRINVAAEGVSRRHGKHRTRALTEQ